MVHPNQDFQILPSEGTDLQIGQRVRRLGIRYGDQDGVIVAVDGPQLRAAGIKLGGGMVDISKCARFSVAFVEDDNPHIEQAIQEYNLRDPKHYTIFDSVASEFEIKQALRKVEEKKSADAKAAEEKAEQYRQTVERIKSENPDLIVVDKENHDGLVIGAKNIRTMLKRQFPGIKFSVRSKSYSMGCSIDISWTDGPTVKMVEEFTQRHDYGRFDGMQDYAYSEHGAWDNTFGGAKHVFENRDYSDVSIQMAITAVCKTYGVEKLPTVEEYKNGRLWNWPSWDREKHSRDLDQLIRLWLCDHTFAPLPVKNMNAQTCELCGFEFDHGVHYQFHDCPKEKMADAYKSGEPCPVCGKFFDTEIIDHTCPTEEKPTAFGACPCGSRFEGDHEGLQEWSERHEDCKADDEPEEPLYAFEKCVCGSIYNGPRPGLAAWSDDHEHCTPAPEPVAPELPPVEDLLEQTGAKVAIITVHEIRNSAGLDLPENFLLWLANSQRIMRDQRFGFETDAKGVLTIYGSAASFLNVYNTWKEYN